LIAKRRGIELVGSSTCRFDLLTKAFRRQTLEWIMAIDAVTPIVASNTIALLIYTLR
jgi:hypothetical protein